MSFRFFGAVVFSKRIGCTIAVYWGGISSSKKKMGGGIISGSLLFELGSCRGVALPRIGGVVALPRIGGPRIGGVVSGVVGVGVVAGVAGVVVVRSGGIGVVGP